MKTLLCLASGLFTGLVPIWPRPGVALASAVAGSFLAFWLGALVTREEGRRAEQNRRDREVLT